MKIEMVHPNGDVHKYDLNSDNAAKDFISDIIFEMSDGGADALAINKAELDERQKRELGERIQYRLDLSLKSDKDLAAVLDAVEGDKEK